jgi:hypothetical protein
LNDYSSTIFHQQHKLITMKFSASISALAIALVTIGSMSAASALEAYKTKSDQVVVTGLKAQKVYKVKYTNTKGKPGQRQISTNSCGEALIDKAGKFQSVMIEGQSIDPKTLKVKVHKKCNPPRKIKTPKVPQSMMSPTPSPSPSPTN